MVQPIKQKTGKNFGSGGGILTIIKKKRAIIRKGRKTVFGLGGMIVVLNNLKEVI